MKRRFNYTGRKRITLDRISITLNRNNGIRESFDAVINLDGLGLPKEANVYIEAYHHTDLRRYQFGTVGNIVSSEDTSLQDMADKENLKFCVIVVDETGEQGLILASADKIRPAGEPKRLSILPVKFHDLGRQVWKIDYNGDEPTLLLNERIPNIHNLAKTDPRFHLYVYPAVVREIFTYMFLVDEVDDLEDPTQEWHQHWLKFIEQFTNRRPIPQDTNHVLTWVDELVEEFCTSRSTEWSKFCNVEEVG